MKNPNAKFHAPEHDHRYESAAIKAERQDVADNPPEADNQRNETRRKALRWGAFDESGNLRAIFDSKSEAHFYLLERHHMTHGSYREIEVLVNAQRLADVLGEFCGLFCIHENLDVIRLVGEAREILAEYHALNLKISTQIQI